MFCLDLETTVSVLWIFLKYSETARMFRRSILSKHVQFLVILLFYLPDDILLNSVLRGSLPDDDINTMSFTTLGKSVSNQGLPNYSFDDINTMSFTTLLSAQIAEW